MTEHEDKQNGNLAGRGMRALRGNMLGTVVYMLAQFGLGIWLARLLGPEPYGLIAIAWMVLGLGNLIADSGLGAALVQKAHIVRQDILDNFSTQVCLGLLLALGVYLSADIIAAWFRSPMAADVLRAMSLVLALQPLGLTAGALMRRELAFARLQQIRVGSYLIGYALAGVPMAANGFGVWSLVTAQLAYTVVFAAALLFCRRHPVWPPAWPHRNRLLGFGAKVTATNIVNWASSFVDTAIVGRFFSTAQLGLYNRAYNLVSVPVLSVASSVQGVLFSACSRGQDNERGLELAFLGSLGGIALLLFPPMVVVAVASETVVLGVYGEQWRDAADVLFPLALALGVHAVMAVCGPVLTAIDKAGRELRAQIVALAVFAVLLVAAATHGDLAWVGWAVLGGFLVRFLLMAGEVALALSIAPARLLSVLIPGVLVAAAVAVAVAPFDTWMQAVVNDAVLRLLLLFVYSVVVYLGFVRLFRHLILSGAIRDALHAIAPSLPRPLRAWGGLPV